MIDHKKMFEETAKWLEDVKMPYNPKAKLGTHVYRTDAVGRDCESSIPAGESGDS